MKKRSRVKSIARWTAWVLAVLLPPMWVVGLFIVLMARTPTYSNGHFAAIGLGEGCILFAHTIDPSKADVQYPPYQASRSHSIRLPRLWWPDIDRSPAGVQVVVPLWIPWLIALAFSVWFYRDHRRAKQRRLLGCCPACGYDRSGLAINAPCPECGAAPTHQ